MSDRSWEKVIGRLVIYRKGWRWTVLWRRSDWSFRSLLDMNGDYR